MVAVALMPLHITQAAVIAANPANYRALLRALGPGDTLLLQAGTYESGLPISNLHGKPGNPITISGPENGFPAIFLGSREQAWNTVQLENASYITVRNLKLDGLGIDGIDGVNARGVTHHIIIEGLKILRHGGSQLTVGIATRGPAWDWIIRNNMIIGAGTGIYLGHWQGKGWPFVGGLIENNLFRDTLGYNMQIKQMRDRNDGDGKAIPGMPTGDRRTIIRHNVFSKEKNGSRIEDPNGKFGPRPNLLVGHFPLSGPGSRDVYEIYGNLFYQNPTEALFQGEGNIALYNNLFVNDSGSAIIVQRHNDRPRQVNIFYNTVIASGKGIRLKDTTPGYTTRVIGNAVFAAQPFDLAGDVETHDNTVDDIRAVGKYLNNPGARLGELDLYPRSGALTGQQGDSSAFHSFLDWDLDFNGAIRTTPYRGAYAGGGKNEGWMPVLEIKPVIRGAQGK